MRNPVFRRPGCRRHAGTTKRRPKKPPRRRWQAVIAPHNRVVHKMIHTAPRREHSPAPPPGCDCVQERFGTPRMSPRPRVAKYGVSHGANHLRSWRNARLRSSSRCVGRSAASAEGHNVACLLDPALTQLCRGWRGASHNCVPKVRPSPRHTHRPTTPHP